MPLYTRVKEIRVRTELTVYACQNGFSRCGCCRVLPEGKEEKFPEPETVWTSTRKMSIPPPQFRHELEGRKIFSSPRGFYCLLSSSEKS
ncbi:hypothetical protein TNCV_3979531 [Trichonephila clavipes]|nr:hypothetical protein TNCV_3979531 [Trichonephila clavipes]